MSFSQLENLEELFLNDEKNMDVEQSLLVLKDLPKLKILHLENDHLKSIPKNLFLLKNLEYLYLNNNSFKKTPIEIQGLKNLKLVDFQGNKFKIDILNLSEQGFGPTIKF